MVYDENVAEEIFWILLASFVAYVVAYVLSLPRFISYILTVVLYSFHPPVDRDRVFAGLLVVVGIVGLVLFGVL